MTLSPTDYRTWRAEASVRDREYAAAYAAGVADEKRAHRRLVVVGAVIGAALLARRLHLHPLVALAWAVLVVLALWPLVVLGVMVELAVRQQRRHASWPRTGAYVLSWLVGIGLVLLAVAYVAPWPLVALAVLVGAWTLGPRVLAWWRHHGRGATGTGGAHPDWPEPEPPFTHADQTLGAGERAPSLPVASTRAGLATR